MTNTAVAGSLGQPSSWCLQVGDVVIPLRQLGVVEGSGFQPVAGAYSHKFMSAAMRQDKGR